MDWNTLCETVLRDTRTDGYAKSYAKAGLSLVDDHSRKVQALYILSNISHWRGATASKVRAALKAYAKGM